MDSYSVAGTEVVPTPLREIQITNNLNTCDLAEKEQTKQVGSQQVEISSETQHSDSDAGIFKVKFQLTI